MRMMSKFFACALCCVCALQAATDERAGRFEPIRLAGHAEAGACEVGPDGHLYVISMQRRDTLSHSLLTRYHLDKDGNPTGETSLVYTWPDTADLAMGITFAPEVVSSNITAYVSVNYGYQSGGEAHRRKWGGRIEELRISHRGRARVRSLIVNLPVGYYGINDITMGPNRKLYICVGASTASGGTGVNSAENAERPLTAAILQADIDRIRGVLDAKTSGGGRFNPYAVDAKLRLYGRGLRQAWDCVWHPNGRLYACVNQNDTNGRTGGGPGIPDLRNIKPAEFLAIVQPERTYGFPNASRGEYVLMGGNPTAKVDSFWEVRRYPIGTHPPKSFDPTLLHRIDNVGGTSANGMIAYRSPGPLQGRLLACFYGKAGKGQIYSFDLGHDGRVVDQQPVGDLKGEPISIVNCLDICEHPTRGHLYVTKYGEEHEDGVDGEVWMLKRFDRVIGDRMTSEVDVKKFAKPGNAPPIVDAGQNFSRIAHRFPTTVQLSGTIHDENADAVFSRWQLIDNPSRGDVEIASPERQQTAVTLSQPGRYSFRLRAHDGKLHGKAEVTVTVDEPGNQQPKVRLLEATQRVRFGDLASVRATALDDGLPDDPGRLRFTWERVGTGVGIAEFGNPHGSKTDILFRQPGFYTIRFTADDGALTAHIDTKIEVIMPEATKPALLLVGNNPISLGDRVILERMEAAKLAVTILVDEHCSSDDAENKRLIFIAPSVDPRLVNDKFRDVNVPVVVADSWLFDDMAMTSQKSQDDFGILRNPQSYIVIEEDHPLAAGFEGVIRVSQSARYGFGRPFKTAVFRANLGLDNDRAAIFAYDRGTMIGHRKSPGRRVGLYFDDAVPHRLTHDGRRLLDAAISWSVAE
jgi:hypothetical protein